MPKASKSAPSKDRRVYVSGSNFDYLKIYMSQHGYRDLADTVNAILSHYRVSGEQGMAIAQVAQTLAPVFPQPSVAPVDPEMRIASTDELLSVISGDDLLVINSDW